MPAESNPPPAVPTEPVPPPLAPAAEPPRLPLPEPERHRFIFHGEAREYFRIWIVNTLLTLLTAGLFSAWAKVRKRRYLRGCTELMGHRFDYRANPRRILLGNVIVAALFLAYSVFGQVYWQVAVAALLLGLVLLPWVIIRSLAFNAHNTSYRGLRFNYRQTYGMAAMTYLGQGALLPFSLGLYYPAWMRNRREFTIGSHRLGDAFFRFDGASGPFYSAYLVSGFIVFGGLVWGGLMTLVLTQGFKVKPVTLTAQLPVLLSYGFALYLGRHILYARLFNHVWNHTRLDRHRFVAQMNSSHWLKLQLVNLGAILISCGLLYPWAAIRSARYALECLHFEPAGELSGIQRLGGAEGSALGDSAGEFIGMDLGL